MTAGRPRSFDPDVALEKALHVFREKGYDGASLPDLTAAMGINRPSMYAAFGNKEELFRKALDRYQDLSMKPLMEALEAPSAQEVAEKVLYGIADGSACPKSPKGCLLVQGALACGDDSQHIKAELAQRRSHLEFLFRQRFERAIAEGDLAKSASAADLAAYLTTTMHGMSVQASGGMSADELRKVAGLALAPFEVASTR